MRAPVPRPRSTSCCVAEDPVVYTLMVEVGRSEGDGLPEDCDGAAVLVFCAGRGERNAVDEAVAVLREAGMAPLSVESHGSIAEREAAGQPLSEEDAALAARALAENAVIVLQVMPFHDDDDEEDEDGGSDADDAPRGAA